MKIPLWVPAEERKQTANITAFTELVNKKFAKNFLSYDELYQWSVENISDFWGLMWEYGGVKYSQPYQSVVINPGNMLECKWFAGARLNFAENLLRYRNDKPALIFKGEVQEARTITYNELYEQVARLSRSLRDAGIKAGDRVAAFIPNMAEAVIAMLATTSIGAIWSSCSPDFGVQGALDRFSQIEPRILFTANGYSYNGKQFDSLGKVKEFSSKLPSIEKIIVVPYTEARADIDQMPNAVHYEDFLSPQQGLDIQFAQLPFDHPVYILYSSGTTGKPKCIVHGAGGTLLQHLKELKLHTDLKQGDTIFYFSTTSWMMWNWLISSLAVGAAVVLFDGSPFYPDAGTLFRYAQDLNFTVFGTSAKYLATLEQEGVKPRDQYKLDSLKTILSTGSPLSLESFAFVYREIKKDICLSSISGGTDIISCFALGNPALPVYTGELQCRGLGMKIEAFDEKGSPVVHEKGELVCTAPFPSMPVSFWNDPEQKKYRAAYFEVYPNVWHHGDYVEMTDTGGVIIYGRSDATLNPAGVRIGTAEIYRQVEIFPQIADSLVVGQQWQNDERVILFVKMAPGENFSKDLETQIRNTIKQNTTPRHIPAKIIEIKDIPYTNNMKKVEIAVRKIIHNEEVTNRESLANPESLDLYKDIPELQY